MGMNLNQKFSIQDQDISIVVQGPILLNSSFGITNHTTKLVCQRIRILFHERELILSTWQVSNVDDIPHDKLVISDDPGATSFIYREDKIFNNCNRLITSTRHGIEAATRKYVFKIRSDLFVFSKSFLSFFDRFKHYDPDSKFVKSRILAFSIHSLKKEINLGLETHRPYHISDWAYFGYKEDLWNLYDIPLTPEPEFSQWFLTHPRHHHDLFPARLWKMSPEEYITSSFFKKFYPSLDFAHTQDVSHHNVVTSERLIANNFLVLDQTQFALTSLKYIELHLLFSAPGIYKTALLYHSWLKDYYRYCHVPPSNQLMIHKIQIKIRPLYYWASNTILKFLNGKSDYIKKLVAYYIKKTSI